MTVEVSDDDDFLKLEEEVNRSSGSDSSDTSPNTKKNTSSDLKSFDILDERKLLNSPSSPNQSQSFSSDSDIDIYTEPLYIKFYLQGILTKEMFDEVQAAQKSGKQIFTMIEVPDTVRRPFQISQDYSDLMVDVINELIDKDNLTEYTYEQYIKKLYDMFNDQVEDVPYKEQSPKEVLAFYKNVSKKNSDVNILDKLFEISDLILKQQAIKILSMTNKTELANTTEKQPLTQIADRKVLIPASSTSPIPPDLLPGDEIIEINEYDSENDIINLPDDQNNHSFSQIQEESYKSHIKHYFPEKLFDKIKADQEAGKSEIELVSNPENDDIISLLNQKLQDDDLSKYSYDEYLIYILEEFIDSQEDYEIDDINEELDD